MLIVLEDPHSVANSLSPTAERRSPQQGRKMIRIFLVFVLVLGVHGTGNGTAVSSAEPESKWIKNFDIKQAVNIIDTVQEMMINVYTGAFGAIGVACVIWSIMVLFGSVFYSYAVEYHNKKDAEKYFYENGHFSRALPTNIPQIIGQLYQQYQAMDKSDTMVTLRGDSCYQRTVCQVQSFFMGLFSKVLSAFLSKGNSKIAFNGMGGKFNCVSQYPDCNLSQTLTNLLWKKFRN